MTRKGGTRSIKTLWIFCEGKTEKLYFQKLRTLERIQRLKVKPEESSVKDAEGIIKYALNFSKKNKYFQKGDVIACVFNRDANTNEQLTKALSLARKHEVITCFSNPSFEYWILCHHKYFESNLEVSELISKIKSHIPDYKKNYPELYPATKDNITQAIKNSKKIHKKHIENNVEILSRASNPVTLIFELIALIDKFK